MRTGQLIPYLGLVRTKVRHTWTMSINVIQEDPILTFGIIADVQYADVDDGTDFSKTRQRFYRNSLNLLKNAVNEWKSNADSVSFILQLGDLIDGKNKQGGEVTCKRALNTALHPFKSLHVPIYHVIGNHELYNFSRAFYLKSALNSSLSLSIQPSPSDKLYYTFLPHPKLRIVAVDSYDLSLLGFEDDLENTNYKTACRLFHEKNTNSDVNDNTGLSGLERRWAAYNGGVSEAQIAWLDRVLQGAQEKEENVIIMSHVPLWNEDKEYAINLVWNYQEVMSVVHKHQCVAAVFAGHEHDGFYLVDEPGVHHITFQGVIETRPDQGNCFATARLWPDRVTIVGVGRVPSFTVPLKYPIR